jgi:N-dimethylarginine dimethylaminohydrolase
MSLINQTVLMSGVDYFSVEELNPYSDRNNQPDKLKTAEEFLAIQAALRASGVTVVRVDSPPSCQDGIYTANWGLCRGDKAILSSLPNMRAGEEIYAREALEAEGFEVIPAPFLFSGQGDALPCGNLLFAGQTYRTDPRMHKFIADELGFEVISLETMPELDEDDRPVINKVTGLPNSYFYDIDLAISILTPELIAWCPEAFTPESQAKMRRLTSVEKIEVSLEEALEGFACNLISTGERVIMSSNAPELQKAIEEHGLKTVTPEITELAKGGGYIRCTTLTLANQ